VNFAQGTNLGKVQCRLEAYLSSLQEWCHSRHQACHRIGSHPQRSSGVKKKGAIALSRWGGDFGADIRMVASHYRELCGSKKREIVFRKAAPTQNCICCTKFYFVYNHYIHKSVCTIMVTYVFDHGNLELCLVAVFFNI
jgi:hypothetical protein